jgi:hypothetical protein
VDNTRHIAAEEMALIYTHSAKVLRRIHGIDQSNNLVPAARTEPISNDLLWLLHIRDRMYRARHKSVNTNGLSNAPGSQYIVIGGKAARNAWHGCHGRHLGSSFGIKGGLPTYASLCSYRN